MYRKLVLGIAIAFAASSTLAKTDDISITKAQSKTLIEIVETLSRKHFRTQPVNNELSRQYYDNLLANLDPNKAYLLERDVLQFAAYQRKLDDYLKEGDLSPGYRIYNLYQNRLSDRLESNIALLENAESTFDFSAKESLPLNRDETGEWFQTLDQADEYWRKRVKSAMLNLVLADKTEQEARETLIRRYTNQLKRLQQQDQQDVFELLVNSLTEIYDPHTNYFSPRTEENFNINMSLSLEGIGAVLQTEDEFTKVVRIVTAGPADKQGELKPADRITAVGQGVSGELVDVVGWRLDEVVNLVRGKKGSVVRLQVIPAGSAQESDTKIVTITRNKVKLEEQAAKKAIFEVPNENGETTRIGVIDIPAFYLDFDGWRRNEPDYKSTTRDVGRLLEELTQEDVDGIILDLRNNGGGSLTEATYLTDLFIDPGPVVQIRETNQEISRRNRSRHKAIYRGALVVLINRLSASASEIFAGAIQDYNRGLIVGTQSFGKGTVQTLTQLHEGQLKITESKFYRVSGDSTQHRGVIPDISLPQVIDPAEVGESTYDTALPWDQIHAVRHDKYIDFSTVMPTLTDSHEQRTQTDPDLQFIIDQFAMAKELQEQTSVSLNKDERVAEKKAREQRLLELENKRRLGRGEPALKDFAELKAEDAEEAPDQFSHQDINPDEDALLRETGHILADYIRLRARQQTAVNEPLNEVSR
jgi:carboxyl-terminal processing protease